ncbi:hypothetical protein B0H13DRAFT_2355336 [Mycena leptocephala]|nr:hypothetical protein B0H13DRAFT_2355336 [Mycena leptocephala]
MSAAFSFTVVFYDYVITIDDEVNAIWNNPSVRWHSKAVFVANRYVTAAILALVIYPKYSAPLHTCLLGVKPVFLVTLLGVGSSFDFVLLLFVVFNAMDRPRLTDVPIISALQKDGVGILLALFVVRFANFIISIFLDMSKVFVAITTLWALYTILNARLHMRLEALTSSRSHGPIIMLANM